MMLFPFLVITLFGAGFTMEEHELAPLKTKQNEVQRNIVHPILKEKYSDIFFDFLGLIKATSSSQFWWDVEVHLDQATNAKFECKTCGTHKECRLKTVNGEHFDGEVQLQFHVNDRHPCFKIYIQSLYVADYKPYVPGKLILNLVKKMVDSVPDAVATLDDASNVKALSLLTTGRSYYEHLGFHYVHNDGTKMTKKRRNFQETEINAMIFQNCVSQKLNQKIQTCVESFLFDEHLKKGIVDALRVEVGSENRRLEDFWNIYRNVSKNVDFHALQEKYKFDEHLQRYSKTIHFTRHFRFCLQEQIIDRLIDGSIIITDGLAFDYTVLDRMSYP